MQVLQIFQLILLLQLAVGCFQSIEGRRLAGMEKIAHHPQVVIDAGDPLLQHCLASEVGLDLVIEPAHLQQQLLAGDLRAHLFRVCQAFRRPHPVADQKSAEEGLAEIQGEIVLIVGAGFNLPGKSRYACRKFQPGQFRHIIIGGSGGNCRQIIRLPDVYLGLCTAQVLRLLLQIEVVCHRNLPGLPQGEVLLPPDGLQQ